MRESRRRSTAGFTLLELMTVVAIIGSLAAVALPAFVKYIRKAKTVEAMINLETIAALQRAYRVDHGHYLACAPSPRELTCQGKAQGQLRLPWDVLPAWEALGFRPEGLLYYRYQVRLAKEGFVAEASGDLDCNGKRSLYRLTTRSALHVENEIE